MYIFAVILSFGLGLVTQRITNLGNNIELQLNFQTNRKHNNCPVITYDL